MKTASRNYLVIVFVLTQGIVGFLGGFFQLGVVAQGLLAAGFTIACFIPSFFHEVVMPVVEERQKMVLLEKEARISQGSLSIPEEKDAGSLTMTEEK